MFYPRRNNRRAWMIRMAALAVGFAVLSYLVGSLVAGRFATPIGVLIATVAGVLYALAMGRFLTRTQRRRALLRRQLLRGTTFSTTAFSTTTFSTTMRSPTIFSTTASPQTPASGMSRADAPG